MYSPDVCNPEMDVYRSIEKLFRNLTSISAAIEAVQHIPDFMLHSDPNIPEPLTLTNGVTLYRSYLSESAVESLATELLTSFIDPPHHSNLSAASELSQDASLFEEYKNLCGSGDFTSSALRRLRWACSGLHYDWAQRSYCSEKFSYLSETVESIYRHFSANEEAYDKENEKMSCLMNLYHKHRSSDRLGGHRDDVEASRSPLVLVSLGSPGLLLLGLTQGVILYSGDVLVMQGEGRDVLHGVPCVFHSSEVSRLPDGSVADFLKRTRISLSIRRVF